MTPPTAGGNAPAAGEPPGGDGLAALVAAVATLARPWMVGGSIGAMCYAEPRATLDVGCIVDLGADDAGRCLDAFPEQLFYAPPVEVVRHEIVRGARGSFNIIHHASGMKADIYPVGDDDLMRWGLAHVRAFALGSLSLPVAPPEYIAAMKLRYFAISGQEKHLRDVRSMLRLTPDLDRTLVAQWAARYGVDAAWRLAAGPIASR
jgi:hypothetical protein